MMQDCFTPEITNIIVRNDENIAITSMLLKMSTKVSKIGTLYIFLFRTRVICLCVYLLILLLLYHLYDVTHISPFLFLFSFYTIYMQTIIRMRLMSSMRDNT